MRGTWLEAPEYSGIVVRSEPNGPIRAEIHNLACATDPKSPHYIGRERVQERVDATSPQEQIEFVLRRDYDTLCMARAYRDGGGGKREIQPSEWQAAV